MKREKWERLKKIAQDNGVNISQLEKAKRQRFKSHLSDLIGKVSTTQDVQNHPLIQRIYELSDDSRILILRALIYNPCLTKAFLNNEHTLSHIVDLLLDDNKKINIQMAEPIDARVRSCSGDTLMHCAARMGLRRLLIRLYNAGASDSLTLTNSHGYTPFDSVMNQIDRITDSPNIKKRKKAEKIFHLEKVRSTLNSLQYRNIFKNQNAIVKKLEIADEEHKELTDIVTTIPQQILENGLKSGLLNSLGKMGEWVWKQMHKKTSTLINEDSAHNADEIKLKNHQKKSDHNKHFIIFYGVPSPQVIEYMTRGMRTRH